MIALREPDAAFSFADYLAWEETQTERHEFVGGVAYAMTGGTQAHHEVTANAFAELRRIYGDHCRVYSQGFKVRVQLGLDDRAYYPDVFVTCQPGGPDALASATENLHRFESDACWLGVAANHIRKPRSNPWFVPPAQSVVKNSRTDVKQCWTTSK